MTRLDLARVLSLLIEAEPTQWRRRVVAEDVAQLGDWIARKGRQPEFRWNGDKHENSLSLRLHAYAVRLANEDGIASPENPMVAARSECSTPRHLRPSPTRIVERRTEQARRRLAAEDVDQSHWPDGARDAPDDNEGRQDRREAPGPRRRSRARERLAPLDVLVRLRPRLDQDATDSALGPEARAGGSAVTTAVLNAAALVQSCQSSLLNTPPDGPLFELRKRELHRAWIAYEAAHDAHEAARKEWTK